MPNLYAKMFQEGSKKQDEESQTSLGELKEILLRAFWITSLGLIFLGITIVGYILYVIVSI